MIIGLINNVKILIGYLRIFSFGGFIINCHAAELYRDLRHLKYCGWENNEEKYNKIVISANEPCIVCSIRVFC